VKGKKTNRTERRIAAEKRKRKSAKPESSILKDRTQGEKGKYQKRRRKGMSKAGNKGDHREAV
jgi:hypothetical protein